MALRLATADPDFQDRFQALLASKREASADVDAVVRDIIEDVRAKGDAALLSYTERFDRLKAASVAELTVTAEELREQGNLAKSRTVASYV